jgi:hypothetical protein
VTNRPAPWNAVFKYLATLADAQTSAASYATKVCRVFEVVVEETGDAPTARDFFLSHVSAQYQLGAISAQHRELVIELLPKSAIKGRGRPKEALGKSTYDRKYKLYLDWISGSTADPSLTKEEFAKQRLGITDEKHNNSNSAHARVVALLQDLKPARMKYLDEDQRRALDVLYPLVLTRSCVELAREWHEAKRTRPALTKIDFVRDSLEWGDGEIGEALIRQKLDYLEQGEKQLAFESTGSDRSHILASREKIQDW